MRHYEIIHVCNVGAIIRLLPDPVGCKHEWKEVYYGHECVKCEQFYAFGCAPWDDPEEGEDEETEYD